MNRNEGSVPPAWNGNGSDLGNSRAGFLRSAILVAFILLALAFAPAPRAAETQLNIRITPRAAALIVALERDMTSTIAPSSLPAPSSNMMFAQSCNADGGNVVVARGTGFKRLVCV